MSITREQLELQIKQLSEVRTDTRIIGIHTTDWSGNDSVSAGDATFRVSWCESPLAVSEQLAALGDGERLVLLTPLTDGDLGADVLARLARRRLIHPERWQMVRDAYRVSKIDPRLPVESWMAEALLAAAPVRHHLPANFLDADAAWEHVLDHVLGLRNGRPDADAIVKWSMLPDAANPFCGPRRTAGGRGRAADGTNGGCSRWTVRVCGHCRKRPRSVANRSRVRRVVRKGRCHAGSGTCSSGGTPGAAPRRCWHRTISWSGVGGMRPARAARHASGSARRVAGLVANAC